MTCQVVSCLVLPCTLFGPGGRLVRPPKENNLTDHQLLAVLVALGILVNLYALVVTVQIYREVRETLLTGRVTLDAVGELLREIKAARR